MENHTTDQIREIIEEFGDDLEQIIGAIGNKIRMIIIASLIESAKDFSELQEITGLSKTALAHHLEKLVGNSIIKNISRGKYEITKDGTSFLQSMISTFMETKRKKEIESKKRAEQIVKFYSQATEEPDELQVQFVRLQPMRVVSFHAISETPENDALNKLRSWAESIGLILDPDIHPIFGFDNPSPIRGKKEYGYEFWLKIDDDFESDKVVIKNIPEKFCAVTRCIVNDPYKDIPNTWKRIMDWINNKGYRMTGECGYERMVGSLDTKNFILDLYIPMVESSIINNK